MPNAKDYRSWRLQKLADPEIAKGYLNDALSESWDMFLKAVLNVAQARQVAIVADEAGITRENIYRAFCEGGNPTADTLNAVLGAFGLEIKEVELKGSRKSESATGIPSVRRRAVRKSARKRRTPTEDLGQLALQFGPLNAEAAGASNRIATGSQSATYHVAEPWTGANNMPTGLQYAYANQEDAGAPARDGQLVALPPVPQSVSRFLLRI